MKFFRPSARPGAFTLVEMLVVMVIIAILAGLILMGAGYAQKSAARKRAGSEIAAMEAALESYKADNGIYPTATTITFNPPPSPGKKGYYALAPSSYKSASLELYKALSGDTNLDRIISQAERAAGSKQYMEFNPSMLEPSGGTGAVTAIIDPFGNSYGYSTAYQADPTKGFNPTFDLWSTAGSSVSATDDDKDGEPDTVKSWITNW